jgi:hypothetical protein
MFRSLKTAAASGNPFNLPRTNTSNPPWMKIDSEMESSLAA